MREALTKRQYLRRTGSLIGAAGAASLAGCSSGSGDATSESPGDGSSSDSTATESGTDATDSEGGTDEVLGSSYDEEHTVLLSDGNIHIPFYLSPDVQSHFDQRGISIAPEVAAYERSSRALSTGPAMINPVAPAEWINMVSSDSEIALIGAELKQINGIFTSPDSDIEEPQDLEGASLGVPFMNSGTAKMMGAMLQDAYDIDIREDVESESAAPSVLYNQMIDSDSLDAVMLWTGTTVEALANDSELEQVMSATEHWTEQTGEPPTILNYGVRRDWLEEHPSEALGYILGWEDGISWAFQENQVENLYEQFGRIGGITSDAEFETVLELFDNERILLREQSDWNEDLVDAQWDLYELMEETGFIDAAPSRDLGITHSELTDMVDTA